MTNYNRLATYIVLANSREEKKKDLSRMYYQVTRGCGKSKASNINIKK